MLSRWSSEKNIKFINEYQRNDCLWDPKHPQYKNRVARDAAYKSIMGAMEMETVKDVVTKIRILRNTYNNEKLKEKKCTTTGMATNPLYTSKIPWLSHLDFLKNIDSYTRQNIKNEAPNSPNTSSASESVSSICIPTRNKRRLRDPLLNAVETSERISAQQFSKSNDEFDLFGLTVAQQLRQLPLDVALETEEMILSTIRKQRIRVAKLEPQ